MSKNSNIPTGGLVPNTSLESQDKTGSWSDTVASVDHQKCIKCHTCVSFCPEGCIDILSDEKNVDVNPEYCKGCGVCAEECPVRAIDLVSKKKAEVEEVVPERAAKA